MGMGGGRWEDMLGLKLYVLLCLIFSQKDAAATSGNAQRYSLRLSTEATREMRGLETLN